MLKTNAESDSPVLPRQRETRKLISIEKRSVQILALFLFVSLWFQSWSISLGLILGGGVAILNFHWLWRIMEKVFFDRKWLHSIQALFKFTALVLVIFLILRFTQVDAIAFILGTSTLLLGILYEVIRESLRAERGNS